MKKLIFGYGETGKAVEQFFINNKIDFEIYDDNISDFDRDITDNQCIKMSSRYQKERPRRPN